MDTLKTPLCVGEGGIVDLMHPVLYYILTFFTIFMNASILFLSARIFDSYYFIKLNVFYHESESYLLANKRRLNLYF